VSRYGVIAFASSLDQVGPLARSARDCARVLAAIAGPDPRDATSLPHPVPDYAQAAGSLRGLKVGVPEEYFRGCAAPVADAVNAAVDLMCKEGAERVAVTLPNTDYGLSAYYLIATAECSSNLARYDGVRYGLRAPGESLLEMYTRTRAAGFGKEVKRRIMLGTYALRAGYYDAYYLKAQKVRTLIRRDFAAAFDRCDVIATPTAPQVAFRLGAKVADPLEMYLSDVFTIPCNLAGLPGMSLPCGLASPPDGAGLLPVGLQLVAPPLGEPAIFSAAFAYQRLTDWHRRRPGGCS
jgi:aspartyl-tRNA(Asn)/glutamyl-tRNA(Gln) amidotransferase subunit A